MVKLKYPDYSSGAITAPVSSEATSKEVDITPPNKKTAFEAVGGAMQDTPGMATTSFHTPVVSGIPSQEYEVNMKLKNEELIGKQLANQQARKTISDPLYKILSADDQKSMLDIQTMPTLIKRLKEYSKIIPEDRGEAMSTYVMMNAPGLKTATLTPDQRAFKTATEILVQTITRLYQKGTLSDTDRKVFSEALNAAAEGRSNYTSALDAVDTLTRDKSYIMANYFSKLYGKPEQQFWSLMNLATPEAGKVNKATAPERIVKLKDGSTFTIRGMKK